MKVFYYYTKDLLYNLNLFMKNIYFFINHSLGELDTVLPLIQKISQKNKRFIIIFTVKNIYESFKQNKFYEFVINKYKIKTQLSYIPNKFDINIKKTSNIKLKVIFSYLVLLFKNYFFLKANYFLFENSDSKNVTFLVKKLALILKLNIYVFQHGQSFNQMGLAVNRKTKKNLKFLLFDYMNAEWAENSGYRDFIHIGFPKFYEEWVELVKKYNTKKANIVTIFTREPFHKYYLTPEIYEELFVNSYRVIRNTIGDIKIIIKPHPRENKNFILDIIHKNDFRNIELSNEHAGILCAQSKLTIHFWCSTILDSLSLNIPSIEYFIENKNFKIVEPKGSLYKFHKIDSVSDPKELGKFIKKVVNNTHIRPDICKKLEKIPVFELN